MDKFDSIFAIFFLFLFSLSFVNSNFVCGTVNNSNEFSSSWSKVIIYPEGNLSNFTECKINPENKFCCDLEELSADKIEAGDRIFAEVFDENSNLVAGPVSLILTGQSYDIFPQMKMQRAILINSPIERIFVNQSSILLNVSLASNYNSLNYSLTNFNLSSMVHVCTNCDNLIFPINLTKGKNEIVLTAYGTKEVSEKIIIYNLDYLDFNMSLSCDKCKVHGNSFSAPSGENITFYTYFNASQNISGDFLFYFPSDWTLFNSLDIMDFSLTHSLVSSNIINQKEFLVNYTLQSPKTFFKKRYLFSYGMENEVTLIKVDTFKSKLMPFRISKPFGRNYFNQSLSQQGSPDEPIVLNPKESYLKLIAIFPKVDISESFSNLSSDTSKTWKKQHFFRILTTIPQKDIDKILLLFKVEKGKTIEIYTNKNKIPLDFYGEDSNYTYYSASVHEKGPFTVKTS